MYNGIGLQTPRGSGTNGYVQTNKFLIRGKTSKVVVDGNLGFGPDQGMGGISKKANKEILEHDRKRQIELKLVILEDKLSEQGYTDAEIAEKCEELRHKLEAEASAMAEDGYGGGAIVSDKKVSDTETHQIAARKEKQMEKLRAALGIEDKPADLDIDDSNEREEGEILHDDEFVKTEKNYQDDDGIKNQEGKPKKNENRKRHGSESSDPESTDNSSDSETDYDRKTKRKQKSTRKSKKNVSDDSDSDSDRDQSYRGRTKDGDRYARVSKRRDSSSDSDDSSRSPVHKTMKSEQHLPKNRHNSGNELTDTYKKRAASDRELNRGKRHDLDRDDKGRRHEDDYYKSSDDSGHGTKALEPEGSKKSRRYDPDEDAVDSGQEEIKDKSRRRGRHDSEDDDSDVETEEIENVNNKEKRSRYLRSQTDSKMKGSLKEPGNHAERSKHEHGDSKRTNKRVEDEQIYRKHERHEAEDGIRKREKRLEGEHVSSRRHDVREEDLQGGRKHSKKENIDLDRRKWEKMEDDPERRKSDGDKDDYNRRKIEREEIDVHEIREEDKSLKRKLERRKDDEEEKEADEYRSKKRSRRDEDEQFGRKRESREDDGKLGRNLEKREEDERASRKLEKEVDEYRSKRREREESELGRRKRESNEKGFWIMGNAEGLQHLRSFTISSCRGVTDVAVEAVGKGCPNLKQFVLKKCAFISDNGLVSFAKAARSLESLQLEECHRITQIGFFGLLFNCGPKLKALTMSSCFGFKDMILGFPLPIKSTPLRSVTVSNCPGLGDMTLAMLAKLCPQLQCINFNGLPCITDAGLLSLIESCDAGAGLVKVGLTGCVNVTDNVVIALAKFHGGTLEVLNLEGCGKVTDAGLVAIADDCLLLNELDLSKCAITDFGVASLARSKQLCLQILSLSGCSMLSDKCLPFLVKLGQSLMGLNLQNCNSISSTVVDMLVQRLFRCDILS